MKLCILNLSTTDSIWSLTVFGFVDPNRFSRHFLIPASTSSLRFSALTSIDVNSRERASRWSALKASLLAITISFSLYKSEKWDTGVFANEIEAVWESGASGIRLESNRLVAGATGRMRIIRFFKSPNKEISFCENLKTTRKSKRLTERQSASFSIFLDIFFMKFYSKNKPGLLCTGNGRHGASFSKINRIGRKKNEAGRR